MANQIPPIPKNLENIGKKKKKYLAKRMKDCDPSKIEEFLNGNIDSDIVKAFKNKPNKKRKPKEKVKDAKQVPVVKTDVPKSGEEASSNWAKIVSKNLDKADDKAAKVKAANDKAVFYRRNKQGQLITNDPSLKKELEKKEVTKEETTEEPKSSNIWFDDVDPVLLDVTENGLVEETKAGEALVKSNSFTGCTKVGEWRMWTTGGNYEVICNVVCRC